MALASKTRWTVPLPGAYCNDQLVLPPPPRSRSLSVPSSLDTHPRPRAILTITTLAYALLLGLVRVRGYGYVLPGVTLGPSHEHEIGGPLLAVRHFRECSHAHMWLLFLAFLTALR